MKSKLKREKHFTFHLNTQKHIKSTMNMLVAVLGLIWGKKAAYSGKHLYEPAWLLAWQCSSKHSLEKLFFSLLYHAQMFPV